MHAHQSNANSIKNDSVSIQQALLEQSLTRSGAIKYDYKIIKSYPHSPSSFTEGLIVEKEFLYESVGLYGKSSLRKIDMLDGKIVLQSALPTRYFAEGIAIIDNQLYQLTYLEKTAFVYDKNTFALKKTFHYPIEGWGLTSNGMQLIMSNGSATLLFIDPHTFKPIRHLRVTTKQHQPIPFLNELEYIDGRIYANVWPTDVIVIISPQSGIVEGWINLKGLNPNLGCKMPTDCVTNGVAYNKQDDTLLVTGKNWLYLYAIKLSR